MHHIVRHPLLPWAELRLSTDSGLSYRLHAHAEYSLGVVDAGRASFHHAGASEPLQAGDVVLIEPQVWHACNPPPNAPWSYRMLFINANWLHAHWHQPPPAFTQRAWRCSLKRHTLEAVFAQLQDGQAMAFQATLLALLRLPGVVRPPINTAGPCQSTAIQHAVARLNTDPSAPLHVADLARTAGLSVSHFIRAFKAHTGVTPASYRLNARLQGARGLLAQGAALSDAAAAMGFADQAHLQRSFKAHHAMTPGQYARRSP